MKRRTPRTPGSLPPTSPRPDAATSILLPGQALDVNAQERLIHELDIAIILDDLL